MKPVIVFYPVTLQINNIGLLQGETVKTGGSLTFYVTTDRVVSVGDHTVGYCSEKTPNSIGFGESAEWLHINNANNNFTIHNINWGEYDRNITCIAYDLKKFNVCDKRMFVAQKYGEHFENLCDIIHRKVDNRRWVAPITFLSVVFIMLINFILQFLKKVKFITKHSTTICHFENSIKTLKKSIASFSRRERISVQTINTILSKVVDFLLGLLVLYVFFQNEIVIFRFLHITVEVIIENLRRLLVFLMGSPIGLKLNHSFNSTLGSFFFYHIFLWKTFMEFIRPHLYSIFYILLIPASMGVSYQAAVIEDLIKLCTIHVYCIYIYATRLYGIQVYAVIALWRLFLGRKYNPLRKRVDSYQYNHNQLFIGTLTFTILLFLLPTTLIYYVVFAVFRVWLTSLHCILTCIRVCLQYLPVYSIILWVSKSGSLAGSIILTLEPSPHEHLLKLYVKMQVSPFCNCIETTLPDTEFSLPKIVWGENLHKLFVGGLL